MDQKTVALIGISLGLAGLFVPMLSKGLFYFDIQSLAGVLFGYSAALLAQHGQDKKKK